MSNEPHHFATPREIVQAVGPELAPLLADVCRRRIAALAEALDLPVQTLCLECRLAADDPRVDFGACLFPAAPALPAALRALAGKGRDPLWARCGELLARWAERDPRFAAIPFLCIAFDMAGSALELPAPCLSFCVDPAFYTRRLGLPGRRPLSSSALYALIEALFRSLREEPLAEGVEERLTRALSSVPSIEARHVSLMLSRDPATIKLDVTLARQELVPYLSSLAWPGPAQALQDQLALLVPWQEHLQLNLVIHPARAHPVLEVELCTDPKEADLAQRTRLLRALGARGLVSEAKSAALQRLCAEPHVQGPTGRRFARNWYLKLVFEGAVATSAKAYLGMMPRPSRAPRASAIDVLLPRGTARFDTNMEPWRRREDS